MSVRSNNKIAIITGGASGIGFAIAKKFVNNDIKVILIGRDKTRLKLACETLGDLAGYEEAMRALYAQNAVTFKKQIASWPKDVRIHALTIAKPVFH